MSKEIICVYQDCAMCGSKGQKLQEYIVANKLEVRKVSFASPEGRDLSYKALTEHKNTINRMPFYTDGENFVQHLKDLVEKAKTPAKKQKKTYKGNTRKRINKLVEGKDESNN